MKIFNFFKFLMVALVILGSSIGFTQGPPPTPGYTPYAPENYWCEKERHKVQGEHATDKEISDWYKKRLDCKKVDRLTHLWDNKAECDTNCRSVFNEYCQKNIPDSDNWTCNKVTTKEKAEKYNCICLRKGQSGSDAGSLGHTLRAQ